MRGLSDQLRLTANQQGVRSTAKITSISENQNRNRLQHSGQWDARGQSLERQDSFDIRGCLFAVVLRNKAFGTASHGTMA